MNRKLRRPLTTGYLLEEVIREKERVVESRQTFANLKRNKRKRNK